MGRPPPVRIAGSTWEDLRPWTMAGVGPAESCCRGYLHDSANGRWNPVFGRLRFQNWRDCSGALCAQVLADLPRHSAEWRGRHCRATHVGGESRLRGHLKREPKSFEASGSVSFSAATWDTRRPRRGAFEKNQSRDRALTPHAAWPRSFRLNRTATPCSVASPRSA